jgi:hypothetical protein
MTTLLQMAEERRRYAQVKAIAHFERSEAAVAAHRRLGLAATVSAAIVGTSVFTSLSSEPHLLLQIGTGLLAVAAAVLSALQTFLKYNEVATQHKGAADEYQAAFHRVEVFLLEHSTAGSTATPQQIAALDAITKQLDELSKTAPSIPDAVYEAAQARAGAGPFLDRGSP